MNKLIDDLYDLVDLCPLLWPILGVPLLGLVLLRLLWRGIRQRLWTKE